jgi:chromosome segregation protein
MRLKQITLTGYKTFASKTKFEFGSGITAIIGPNGSGKSNVADAIRWALGEQAFSLLRSKRTDDMIFAGGPKRARASMAEVLMVFDNGDGFFPIEYSEIEIGRRAYRDGTNEYTLNGSRVRLREIADLLSSSGLAERNYTVIGQGAVDTALSQKPEERRALFEEAAGIISYRDRREDALRKLEETRHNLERAKDILAEITPRLAQLERQATRAKQYETLTIELQSQLKIWFGFHYHNTRNALAKASATHAAAAKDVAQALAVLNQFDDSANNIRAEQNTLRASLTAVLPLREDAHRKSEAATRELAVMRERVTALETQRNAAQQDLAQRAAALDDLAVRAAHAAAATFAAQDLQRHKQLALDAAQVAATEHQNARAALESQRAEAQRQHAQVNADLAAARNQINQLQQQKEQLRKRIDQSEQRNAQLAEQRERELARLGELETQIEQDIVRANALEAQHHANAQQLESARTALTLAQSAFAAAEAEERLTSRMSLFAELRAQQGDGELLTAFMNQHAGKSDVRGTLAQFVQVREEDRKAVDAALGTFLHAVVIETQDRLNETRVWLAAQNSAGKLQVLPLDGVRAADETSTSHTRALGETAQAFAARSVLDLVAAPEWLRPTLRALLGQCFVCRDLDTARAVVRAWPTHLAGIAITRDGEVAYAAGALSLVAGMRNPIVLGAGPEFAAPETNESFENGLISPEEATARRETAARSRDAALRQLDTARHALDEATVVRDDFIRASGSRRSERNALAQSIARSEETLALYVGEIEQVESDIESVDAQVRQLDERLATQDHALAAAHARVGDIEQNLQMQLAGGWLEHLNAAHAAFASAAEAVRSAEAVQRERLLAYNDAVKQRDNNAARIAELTTQRDNAQRQLAALQEAVSINAGEVQAADARLIPIQAEIAALEARAQAADAQKREAERVLRAAESRSNAAELEAGKHSNELETLRERAVDAFTDDRVSARVEAQAEESAALVGEQLTFEGRDRALAILEALAPIEQLPEGLNERVQQLRNQIKRLGAINFEAQNEYDELNKRASFITEQAQDLEQASMSLQQVIAELNDVMKATFRTTFDAVAAHFQNTFKILFGGGQAKLILTNPDDIDACGVEIQAQPPGKRPATLALLSGGERSLTATALMFAILRVKPTPFCVLDEVDAALDESNVGRMRNMIESLSDSTQFIIITHNRGTVEAADTIYGITMGTDGASQVLSLRLDEVREEELGRDNGAAVTPEAARAGAGWTPPG